MKTRGAYNGMKQLFSGEQSFKFNFSPQSTPFGKHRIVWLVPVSLVIKNDLFAL